MCKKKKLWKNDWSVDILLYGFYEPDTAHTHTQTHLFHSKSFFTKSFYSRMKKTFIWNENGIKNKVKETKQKDRL